MCGRLLDLFDRPPVLYIGRNHRNDGVLRLVLALRRLDADFRQKANSVEVAVFGNPQLLRGLGHISGLDTARRLQDRP